MALVQKLISTQVQSKYVSYIVAPSLATKCWMETAKIAGVKIRRLQLLALIMFKECAFCTSAWHGMSKCIIPLVRSKDIYK